MSIYEQMIKAEIPTSNHESDLYVKVIKESTRILNEYEHHKKAATTFVHNGATWYDIPFAYDPFWGKKLARA
mgnify:CR=1 FL=1